MEELGDFMDKDDVFDQIEQAAIQPRLDARAGISDRELFQILQQGEDEQDIDKIYRFITSYEMGCYNGPPKILQEMVLSAYEKSPIRLIEILNAKGRLMEHFMHIACLDNDMISAYIRDSRITNPLLLYECIRQLFAREKRKQNLETVIVLAVIQLSYLDRILWKRFLSEFEKNTIFIRILGQVLVGISEESLKDYAEGIQLDLSVQELQNTTNSFTMISDEKQNFILENVAEILYSRWCEHLLSIKLSKKFIAKPIINGYSNLILTTINFLYSDTTRLKDLLIDQLKEFQDDMFLWYEKNIHKMTYYFVGITQIYLSMLVLNGRTLDKSSGELLRLQLVNARDLIIRHKYFRSKNEHSDLIDDIIKQIDNYISI